MRVLKKPFEFEERMIENILENFDFKKCEKVMAHLDWGWGFNQERVTVPMLKESAKKRIRDAMEYAKREKQPNVTYFSSSGGLKASTWVNKFGHIEAVRLEFVITEWDDDADDFETKKMKSKV